MELGLNHKQIKILPFLNQPVFINLDVSRGTKKIPALT